MKLKNYILFRGKAMKLCAFTLMALTLVLLNKQDVQACHYSNAFAAPPTAAFNCTTCQIDVSFTTEVQGGFADTESLTLDFDAGTITNVVVTDVQSGTTGDANAGTTFDTCAGAGHDVGYAGDDATFSANAPILNDLCAGGGANGASTDLQIVISFDPNGALPTEVTTIGLENGSCDETAPFTLPDLSLDLQADIAFGVGTDGVQNAHCGNSDGAIQVAEASGNGCPPYEYSIIAGPMMAPGQAGTQFCDLPSGAYTVQVEDACGATATLAVTIAEVAVPTVVSTGVTVCDGDPATVTAVCTTSDPDASATSSTTNWYSDMAATTLLGSGASFDASVLGVGTTTIYAVCEEVYNTACDGRDVVCASAPEATIVTINASPSAACPAPASVVQDPCSCGNPLNYELIGGVAGPVETEDVNSIGTKFFHETITVTNADIFNYEITTLNAGGIFDAAGNPIALPMAPTSVVSNGDGTSDFIFEFWFEDGVGFDVDIAETTGTGEILNQCNLCEYPDAPTGLIDIEACFGAAAGDVLIPATCADCTEVCIDGGSLAFQGTADDGFGGTNNAEVFEFIGTCSDPNLVDPAVSWNLNVDVQNYSPAGLDPGCANTHFWITIFVDGVTIYDVQYDAGGNLTGNSFAGTPQPLPVSLDETNSGAYNQNGVVEVFVYPNCQGVNGVPTDVADWSANISGNFHALFSGTSPAEPVNWYAGANGIADIAGGVLSTTSPYDPIANGDLDPSVPGVYEYFAVCSCGDCVSEPAQATVTIAPEITVELVQTKCDGNPDGDADPTNDTDEYNYDIIVTIGGDPGNGNTLDVLGPGGITASINTVAGQLVYIYSSDPANPDADNTSLSPIPVTTAGPLTATLTIGTLVCDDTFDVVAEADCSCFRQYCGDVTDTSDGLITTPDGPLVPPVGTNPLYTTIYVLTDPSGAIIQVDDMDPLLVDFDMSALPPTANGGVLCEVWAINYDATDPTTAAYVAGALDITALCYPPDPCICIDVSNSACYIEKLEPALPPTVTPACVCQNNQNPSGQVLLADCDTPNAVNLPTVVTWYADDQVTVVGSGTMFDPIAAGLVSYTTPSVTTFYAQCTNGDGCTSPLSAPVTFEVKETPEAPEPIDVCICADDTDGDTAILVDFEVVAPGATYNVYLAAGDAAPAAGFAAVTPPIDVTSLLNTTTASPPNQQLYISEIVNFDNAQTPPQIQCESDRALFQLEVIPNPDPSLDDGQYFFCADAAATTLNDIANPVTPGGEWFVADGAGMPTGSALDPTIVPGDLANPDNVTTNCFEYVYQLTATGLLPSCPDCTGVSAVVEVCVCPAPDADWVAPGEFCGFDADPVAGIVLDVYVVTDTDGDGTTGVDINHTWAINADSDMTGMPSVTAPAGNDTGAPGGATFTLGDLSALTECTTFLIDHTVTLSCTATDAPQVDPDGNPVFTGGALDCSETVTQPITICPEFDPEWNAGLICCTSDIVHLPGGGFNSLADAQAGGSPALLDLPGAVAGGVAPIYDMTGVWTGDGVFYVDLDGDPSTNDGYYYFDATVDPTNPTPAVAGAVGTFITDEGEISVEFLIGEQPCQNVFLQDFFIACDVDATLDDVTLCKCGCGLADLNVMLTDTTTPGGTWDIVSIDPANAGITIVDNQIFYDPAAITESIDIEISYTVGNEDIDTDATPADNGSCYAMSTAILTLQPTPNNIEMDLPEYFCDNEDLLLDDYTTEVLATADDVTACQYTIIAPDGNTYVIPDDPNVDNVMNNENLIALGIAVADLYGTYTITYSCDIDNGTDPNCVAAVTDYIEWTDFRYSDWISPSPVCAGDAAFILNDLIDLVDVGANGYADAGDVEATPGDDADDAFGEEGGVFSGPFVTDNGDGTFTFDPTDDLTTFGVFTVTYCNGDDLCQECTSIDIEVYPAVDATIASPLSDYCQAGGDIDLETFWETGTTTAGGSFSATYSFVGGATDVPATVIGNEYLDVSSVDFSANPAGCALVTVTYEVGNDTDYYPQADPLTDDGVASACYDIQTTTFELNHDVEAEFSLDPAVVCADAIGEVFTVNGAPTINGTFTILDADTETLDSDDYATAGTITISANGTTNTGIQVQYCVGGTCDADGLAANNANVGEDADSCEECYVFTIEILETVTITEGAQRNFCLSDSNIDFSTFFDSPADPSIPNEEGDDDDGEYYLNGEQYFGSDLVIDDSLVGNHVITYCVGTFLSDGNGTIIYDADGLTVLGLDNDGDGVVDQDLDNCTNCASVSFDICPDMDATWNTPAFLCEDGYAATATDQDEADALSRLYELIPSVVANGDVAGTDYSYYTWSIEDAISTGNPLFTDSDGTAEYNAGDQLTGASIWFDPAGLSDESEIEICLTVHSVGALEDGDGVDLCASCTNTFCYEIPIVSDYEAGLFEGYNQTWCIEDFRDTYGVGDPGVQGDGSDSQGYLDLTQLLDSGITPGNGFFTISYTSEDGSLVDVNVPQCYDSTEDENNPTFADPSVTGCLDGFIWYTDSLDVGDYTIRYTVEGSGQCARYDEITITLEQPVVDCFDPPAFVCESQGSYSSDAVEGAYNLNDWIICGDGCIVEFEELSYTNVGGIEYTPYVDGDPNCYPHGFINPGTQNVSIAAPVIPVGSTILSIDVAWSYEAASCITEGDLDAATVAFPDGTVIESYGNDAGPNGNDLFGWQSTSYTYDDLQDPGLASAVNSLLTCTPGAFTYDLTSNAANFTIGFEVKITWSSCMFEAVLHETSDGDGVDIETIPLPYDQNGDGDYDDELDIPGGVYTEVSGTDITYYFDTNGLNAIDAVVDITYSQASCGDCGNGMTQSILVVDDYLAEFTNESESLCADAGLIDLTQFLSTDSDNGGNFSSDDLTINGDILDVSTLASGSYTITYDVADGVNTCGAATDMLTIVIEEAGDPTGLQFEDFYCEGISITLPGDPSGTWDILGNTYAGGEVLETAGLSTYNPVQATFTVGTGDCANSADYLIVIESSYDAVLAADVAACESAIGGALIMSSNGCVNMDQFVLGNPDFGAGYWTQTAGGGSLSGTIFCPDGADTYEFTFTVPGSGDCGAVRTFTITMNPDADAAFDFPTVLCSGDEPFSLDAYVPELTQTFTGQICVSGDDPEIVNPSYTAPNYAYLQLPAIPAGAQITEVTVDYNYIAGPGNPNADGDLDLYNINMPDGSTIVTWTGNAGPNGNDNHFDFGLDVQSFNDVENDFTFDVSSFVSCTPGAIELEVVSNSAFWDACIDVSITWTTGDFSVSVSETGEDVADLGLAGVTYDGLGVFTFDPTGMCDLNEFTIEFNRFDCFCPSSSTNVFQVVCGGDASLAEDQTVCFDESIDLTQFFTADTDDNGQFSGDGVLGANLNPDAAGGTYTITYTQGIEGSVCGSSDEIIIIVEPALDASIHVPLTLCGLDDDTWDLAGYATNAGGVWAVTNSGASEGGPSFEGSVLSSNGYTGLVEVTYSVSSGECTAADSETIEIVHIVQADLVDVSICYDDDVDLTQLFAAGTSYGGEFTGIYGEGIAAPIAGYTLYPGAEGGTYTITYSVGDAEWNCGMEMGTATLTVAPSIDAEWDGPSSFCANEESYLLSNYFTTTTDADGSWAITSGGGNIVDGAYYPDGYTGFVIISYTANSGDCSETHEEVIQVLGDLDATFDIPASACIGDVIDLCATAVTAGGEWSGMGVEGCTFTAAMPGVFVVTYEVGDDACDNVFSKAITVYDIPNAPALDITEITVCEGDELGTVTITGDFFDHYVVSIDGAEVASGAPFYGNAMTFDPMSVLPEGFTGTATLVVTSENQGGCASEGIELVITVNATTEITYNIGCTDPVSNLAALTVQGLDQPFQIAVYPQGTEPTISDYNPMNDPLAIIEAGVPYDIAVMDANGCAASLEGVIAELALQYEAAISCPDENGNVTVSVTVDENTGYGGPYEYSYNGGIAYTTESSAELSAAANPTISIIVRDTKGCLSEFETFTLGDGGALAPVASCADENGNVTVDLGFEGSSYVASYTFNGEDVIIGNAASFTVNVTDAGMVDINITDTSGSVECELSGSVMVYPALTVSATPDLDGCPQGSASTSIVPDGGNGPFSLTIDGEDAGSFSAVAVEDLTAGTHSIMITDAAGCTATAEVTIPEGVELGTPALVFTSSLSSATSVCGTEELSLEVTGGESYIWTVDGAEQSETGNILTGMYDGPAMVTVAITNADGCVGEALEIPVTYYPELSADEPVIVCNGDGSYSVTFNISGGNVAAPYFVEANGVVFENFGTVTATYNLGTPFSFNISSPESGCSLSVSGADDCPDPSAGQGCNPELTQGNLICEDGVVTVFVSNAGPDFAVESITGGATTNVNVDNDGFGNVQVSFTLDDTNIGSYDMVYNPGGVQCDGSLTFTISVDCSNVTAIELLRFDGEVLPEGNNIFWTTASETNADFFTVQRSFDGVNFQSIGTVNANGNSSTPLDYNLLDNQAPNGVSFYRLLETDYNGITSVASEVIELSRISQFNVIEVYPVPTSDIVNISIGSEIESQLIINVYDIAGKLFSTISYDAAVGVNIIQVDVANYAAGTYFATINNGKTIENTKFIKE